MDTVENPDYGPWRCGYFGFVWKGDISSHHGIKPPGFCPGPHTRDETGLFLCRLSEGWTLHADGSMTAPTDERSE